jgi:hypothetical protein
MKFLVSFLSLGGVVTIVFGLVGGISGLFDYRLVVQGSKLPLITIPGMIAMLVSGGVCLLLARLLSRKMQKKGS